MVQVGENVFLLQEIISEQIDLRFFSSLSFIGSLSSLENEVRVDVLLAFGSGVALVENDLDGLHVGKLEGSAKRFVQLVELGLVGNEAFLNVSLEVSESFRFVLAVLLVLRDQFTQSLVILNEQIEIRVHLQLLVSFILATELGDCQCCGREGHLNLLTATFLESSKLLGAVFSLERNEPELVLFLELFSFFRFVGLLELARENFTVLREPFFEFFFGDLDWCEVDVEVVFLFDLLKHLLFNVIDDLQFLLQDLDVAQLLLGVFNVGRGVVP